LSGYSRVAVPPAIGRGVDRVVFVHITDAHHEMVFDVAAKTLTVVSDVTFESYQRGRAMIDLRVLPGVVLEALLDDKPCATIELDAPRPREDSDDQAAAARFRALDRVVDPGIHRAHFEYRLTPATGNPSTRFAGGTVSCFLAMSDYTHTDRRHFLERYLPSNAEFDQHPIRIDVTIAGATAAHEVIANGRVSGDQWSRFGVTYPDWYTASCPFLYIGPRAGIARHELMIPRADGSAFKTLLFTEDPSLDLTSFEAQLRRCLAELQTSFGEFPHDQLILFFDDSENGEMEYAGAAVVQPGSLFHELAHSYFGRSLLPYNGDAGWIDEAVATWLEFAGTGGIQPLPQTVRNLGALSPWRRQTLSGDAQFGAALLRHFDSELGGKLVDFLRELHRDRARTPIDSRTFQQELEGYARKSFTTAFDRCVYGLSA
jgi:hypothetical protein